MTTPSLIRSLLLSITLVMTTLAEAQTMYIDDTLFVPLRSGPSTSFRIVHKGLRSGTSVEVVEADVEGYAKVRTSTGLEGFLPKRYLTADPIARVKLGQLESTYSKTSAQYEEARSALASLEKRFRDLDAEHQSTLNKLDSTQQELTNIRNISANALTLDQRNRELRETNEQLRNQLELVEVENLRLKDKSESNTLMMGGGLVLLGVFIALIIPMIKPSKKSDSWA